MEIQEDNSDQKCGPSQIQDPNSSSYHKNEVRVNDLCSIAQIYPQQLGTSSLYENKDDSIQVLIRVKPGQQDQCLNYSQTEIKLNKHHFAFDKIFSPKTTQAEIFDAIGHRLLLNTLDGYNGCIFVYGQTGSGKTHTMIGEDNGIMQRSFRELFIRLNNLNAQSFSVGCSYFQLYNEQILDLLDPKKQKKLAIRQDTKRGIFVENLTEQTAFSAEKMLQCLYTGMKNRHVGQTMMNRQSSRSHSIFTVSLSIRLEDSKYGQGRKILKTPKLHFVDLAGSERQKLTSATGDRLKEAGNINRSLTTLGMVINALTCDKLRTHIPYRDSKLTCLLRDSLGGNSKTFIVATIANSVLCFQETLSTLNFANRAKMVKVKAQINEENLSTNVQIYKEEIKRLKAQINRLKSQKNVNSQNSAKSDGKNYMSLNMDLHFQEINNKISVISERLNDNVSPALQQILAKNLQKLKNNVKGAQNLQMLQQKQEEGSDVLIEYLNSNYELLSQVNKKVNDYLHMKHQLRMTLLTQGKISTESLYKQAAQEKIMRSPLKTAENQIYDELLAKKQLQKKQMQNDLHHLRDQLTEKQLKIYELKEKLARIQDSKKDEAEVAQTQSIKQYRENIFNKERQLISLKSKLTQYESESKKSEESLKDYETTIKDLREMYDLCEQKLQGEQYIKEKLQSQLKNMNSKTGLLEKQIKSLKDKFSVQLSEYKEKIQNLEGSQEELKGEISILQQTLQFHQKKATEFSEKSKSLQLNNEKLKKSLQSLSVQKTQIEERITQMESRLSSMDEIMSEMQKSNQRDIQKLRTSEGKNHQISNQYEVYKKQSELQKRNIQNQNMVMKDQLQRLNQNISNAYRIINKNENEKQDYERKLNELQNLRKTDVQALQETIKLLQANNNQILLQKQQIEEYASKIDIKFNELSQKLYVKTKELEQVNRILESTKNIREENDQLRKSYQTIIKENYKLKAISNGKYQNSEQLFSKVQYYEQKFKLMSMEYKKATESVKRLKEKQLQQSKVIHNLQQNAKMMKINRSSLHLEETIKILEQENEQLKKKWSGFNDRKNENQDYTQSMHQEKSQTKAEQRELNRAQLENLTQRIENFVLKYGNKGAFQSRQNLPEKIAFEDLIILWQKIESETKKKLQCLAQGIQKEQKLKSQNNFILKENIYLKEKLSSMQKQYVQLSGSKNPRKMAKLNQKVEEKFTPQNVK